MKPGGLSSSKFFLLSESQSVQHFNEACDRESMSHYIQRIRKLELMNVMLISFQCYVETLAVGDSDFRKCSEILHELSHFEVPNQLKSKVDYQTCNQILILEKKELKTQILDIIANIERRFTKPIIEYSTLRISICSFLHKLLESITFEKIPQIEIKLDALRSLLNPANLRELQKSNPNFDDKNFDDIFGLFISVLRDVNEYLNKSNTVSDELENQKAQNQLLYQQLKIMEKESEKSRLKMQKMRIEFDEQQKQLKDLQKKLMAKELFKANLKPSITQVEKLNQYIKSNKLEVSQRQKLFQEIDSLTMLLQNSFKLLCLTQESNHLYKTVATQSDDQEQFYSFKPIQYHSENHSDSSQMRLTTRPEPEPQKYFRQDSFQNKPVTVENDQEAKISQLLSECQKYEELIKDLQQQILKHSNSQKQTNLMIVSPSFQQDFVVQTHFTSPQTVPQQKSKPNLVISPNSINYQFGSQNTMKKRNLTQNSNIGEMSIAAVLNVKETSQLLHFNQSVFSISIEPPSKSPKQRLEQSIMEIAMLKAQLEQTKQQMVNFNSPVERSPIISRAQSSVESASLSATMTLENLDILEADKFDSWFSMVRDFLKLTKGAAITGLNQQQVDYKQKYAMKSLLQIENEVKNIQGQIATLQNDSNVFKLKVLREQVNQQSRILRQQQSTEIQFDPNDNSITLNDIGIKGLLNIKINTQVPLIYTNVITYITFNIQNFKNAKKQVQIGPYRVGLELKEKVLQFYLILDAHLFSSQLNIHDSHDTQCVNVLSEFWIDTFFHLGDVCVIAEMEFGQPEQHLLRWYTDQRRKGQVTTKLILAVIDPIPDILREGWEEQFLGQEFNLYTQKIITFKKVKTEEIDSIFIKQVVNGGKEEDFLVIFIDYLKQVLEMYFSNEKSSSVQKTNKGWHIKTEYKESEPQEIKWPRQMLNMRQLNYLISQQLDEKNIVLEVQSLSNDIVFGSCSLILNGQRMSYLQLNVTCHSTEQPNQFFLQIPFKLDKASKKEAIQQKRFITTFLID